MKTPKFVLGFALVLLLLESSPAQSFLTNGLVAYYPFKGNANDASGNGKNGTVYGAILTNDFFGTPDSAYYFNGQNGFIQLPNQLVEATVQGFSFSAWITADNISPNQVILEQGDDGGEVYLFIDAAGQFSFGAQILSVSNSVLKLYQASALPIKNTVTHLVGVYQKGQQLLLYTNGVLANQVAIPNGNLWLNYSYPLLSSIGCYDYSGSPYQFFNGVIADVRIYNRALSSNDVAQLYSYESTPPPPGIPVPPASQSTVEGSEVVLSVTPSGTGPFSYQWSFNGTNLPGATNATLNLADIHPYQSGDYTVTVTTPYGSASASATVTVIAQTILIYDYSGIEKDLTGGHTSSEDFSGRLFFIPATTNGMFVGWNSEKGKRHYWVNPLSDYLLTTVSGEGKQTITLLGQAGQSIMCHRAVQNQPEVSDSKPATLRCGIHIISVFRVKGFSL